jgi:hypothetical protein
LLEIGLLGFALAPPVIAHPIRAFRLRLGEGSPRRDGFELDRTTIFDAVPKRQLEGDLVVGGQLRDRSLSGRCFGGFIGRARGCDTAIFIRAVGGVPTLAPNALIVCN